MRMKNIVKARRDGKNVQYVKTVADRRGEGGGPCEILQGSDDPSGHEPDFLIFYLQARSSEKGGKPMQIRLYFNDPPGGR